MVIAGREGHAGPFIGFELDPEILECRECKNVEYRLRYTKDEQGGLKEDRLAAFRLIQSEHPKHSDKIRIR